MNIILCGMPMCGKTTLGQMMAQRLIKPFIDTDAEIEKSYFQVVNEALPCREIHRQLGEKAFRRWEHLVIQALRGTANSIIATGGGALCQQENVSFIKSMGVVLYLQVDNEVLVQRLCHKLALPSYLNPQDPAESLKELSVWRCKLYEELADIQINASSAVAEEVVSQMCVSVERRKQHGQ